MRSSHERRLRGGAFPEGDDTLLAALAVKAAGTDARSRRTSATCKPVIISETRAPVL